MFQKLPLAGEARPLDDDVSPQNGDTQCRTGMGVHR